MLRLLTILALAATVSAQCGWETLPLETTGSPFLNKDQSGFNSKDVLSTYFYLPSKWDLNSADYSDAGAIDGEVVTPHGLGNANDQVDGKSGDCYKLFEISAGWGSIVPTCARAETASEIEFTCKVELSIQEDLEAIRGQGQVRNEIFELPVQVIFPKQVSAHLENLSVFDNLNNIAAIIYQEVDVNVNDLSVDAKVRIFSSLQWPFKCDPASVVVLTDTPGVSVVEGASQDCVDANAGDIPNSQPGDANACNQVFEILLTPSADPRVCELDGNYAVTCNAVCQPSFPTDCPLVKDDNGGVSTLIRIDYTLDSEYFCPQLVDEVDISASLAAYKDHAHTVPASNFVVGQTIYFKATSSSGKATVVSTVVNHISTAQGPLMNDVFNRGNNPACDPLDNGSQGFVTDLVVEDGSSSGTCEINVPTQANFQWLICEGGAGCPFNPPVDGQTDFDVWVTLDITFKDVDAPALLEENSQRARLMQLSTPGGSNIHRATTSAAIEGDASSDASTIAVGSAFLAVVSALAL